MIPSSVLDQIVQFQAPNVFNPWASSDPLDIYGVTASAHRLARLAQHFDCNPRYMLIGEAPGYQGCHFSGVPFTNEALLLRGVVPRVPCVIRITTRARPWSEPSATIVWDTLHKLGIADCTVMWNAFAWHPYRSRGGLYSNRAPNLSELTEGAPVLRAVVESFKDARIIAVGNVAEWILHKFEIKVHAKVRHPSMGGANKFRIQMSELFGG